MMFAGIGVDISISNIDIAHRVQTRKLGFSGILQLWVMFYYGCTCLSNWIQIVSVSDQFMLESCFLFLQLALLSQLLFELNNAGAVCIIVESWSLKVTTPDGTSNLQCNWEFLDVVFGWGRKLTTGCSYGGDVWTSMSCVAEWSIKKLWNWNTWLRKVLVAGNRTVIFVCLSIILLGIVYLSINQSINYNPNWYCLSTIQSVIQSIHPSIHPSNWLFISHWKAHCILMIE